MLYWVIVNFSVKGIFKKYYDRIKGNVKESKYSIKNINKIFLCL